MSRKTFSVEEFRASVNHFLQHSKDDMVGNRQGMATALESVLHASGNYKGFGYLNREDMADSDYGSTVGINTTRFEPSESMTYEQKFEGTDKSRVVYF